MAGSQLTTVANVEATFNIAASAATNALIARLITAASAQIYAFLGRGSLLSRNYNETRDGTGTRRLILRNWPVTSVASLSIDGAAITAGSYAGTPPSGGFGGYYFEAWDGLLPGRMVPLELVASLFCRGKQNVAVTYTAGYLVAAEGAAVPASPFKVTVQAPLGSWAADVAVTYSNGTPLTKVASAPAVGQYALDATAGVYDFAAADSGQSVLISYSFIPAAIEQACIELVGQLYAQATQMQGFGNVSRMRAGDTELDFTDPAKMAAMPLLTPTISAALQPYRRVVPV